MTVMKFVSMEWDSLAALGCDRLVPGVILVRGDICSTHPQWTVSTMTDDSFNCSCRNRDHGGRGAKALQEEATHGISPSHSRAFPAFFPRAGEEATGEWKMEGEEDGMHISFRHTPSFSAQCNLHMNAVVFFISKN